MTDTEQFIATFTEIWSAPDPERFPELFTDDGWLLHPGMQSRLPVAHVVEYISGVKAASPDIHLVVSGWAERDGVIYIDWTMHASVDGTPVSWIGADKCVMDGARAKSITAFFDTHPLWVAVDPSMERDVSLEAAAARRAAAAA